MFGSLIRQIFTPKLSPIFTNPVQNYHGIEPFPHLRWRRRSAKKTKKKINQIPPEVNNVSCSKYDFYSSLTGLNMTFPSRLNPFKSGRIGTALANTNLVAMTTHTT